MRVLCHRGGCVMHWMPHTAGLTRKPHYCKLPHFTQSKGAKKKKKKTSGQTFLMVGLKQSTCTQPRTIFLTCFMKFYCQVHGSSKVYPLLFYFSAKVNFTAGSLQACCSVLMHVWCSLPSPQRRGRGAGEDHRDTRSIPSRDSSISPPTNPLMSVVSLFQRPVLEIISYCCFILSSFFFFFFCCCSDETFFFWCWSCFLFSVAAALHSAFCCRGWVFLGVEEKRRGRGLGAPPGQWFPNRSWEDCIDIRMRKSFLFPILDGWSVHPVCPDWVPWNSGWILLTSPNFS